MSIIRDLYRHMEWADAAVWGAVLASDSARGDSRIIDLLQHFHETQRGFLWIWQKAPLERWTREELEPEALVRSARAYHVEAMRFLDNLGADAMDEPVVLPWAARVAERLGRDTVSNPTLGETLLQVPWHSTHHRAQVSARLRELGGEPPLTDFIAWVWFGKPAADWPA